MQGADEEDSGSSLQTDLIIQCIEYIVFLGESFLRKLEEEERTRYLFLSILTMRIKMRV